MEFLIRPYASEELLALNHASAYSVLVPAGWVVEPVADPEQFHYRFEGSDLFFSLRVDGWYIVVEGPMTRQTAEGLVAEVAAQIAHATGVPTEWGEIS